MPWGTDRVERPPRDPTLMEIETSPEKRVKKWKPKKHKPKSSPRPEDLDEIDAGLVKTQVMGVQSQRYVIQPALKDQIERTAEAARAAKSELERRQQLAIHIQAAERRRQAVYQRKSAEAEKLSAVLVARQREEARQQQQQQGEGVLNAIGNFILAPMALAAGEMALAAGSPSQALPPPPLFVGGMPDAPSTRRRDMPLLNTDKARNQTAAVERAKRVAENAAIMGSIEAAKDEAAELEAAKAEAAKWRQESYANFVAALSTAELERAVKAAISHGKGKGSEQGGGMKGKGAMSPEEVVVMTEVVLGIDAGLLGGRREEVLELVTRNLAESFKGAVGGGGTAEKPKGRTWSEVAISIPKSKGKPYGLVLAENRSISGAVVAEMAAGTSVAKAGMLLPGDCIQEINGTVVRSVDEAMAALKAAQDVGETSAAIAIKLARMDGLPDGWAVSLKGKKGKPLYSNKAGQTHGHPWAFCSWEGGSMMKLRAAGSLRAAGVLAAMRGP